MARPRHPEPRQCAVTFKVSAQERARLHRVAILNRQTVSEFIREAVIENARDCTDDPVFRVSVLPKPAAGVT